MKTMSLMRTLTLMRACEGVATSKVIGSSALGAPRDRGATRARNTPLYSSTERNTATPFFDRTKLRIGVENAIDHIGIAGVEHIEIVLRGIGKSAEGFCRRDIAQKTKRIGPIHHRSSPALTDSKIRNTAAPSDLLFPSNEVSLERPTAKSLISSQWLINSAQAWTGKMSAYSWRSRATAAFPARHAHYGLIMRRSRDAFMLSKKSSEKNWSNAALTAMS